VPLSIAVCVKRVPDTAADKLLDPSDFTLDRDSVESILNPVDEVAVEAALRLKETHGGEVAVVCAGPEEALTKAVRKALSMGCDRAVHLSDPVLHGSDALAIAYALSQVLRAGAYDLIVCGSESTDSRTSLVPPAVAEYLGLPGLCNAREVQVRDGRVRIHRERDQGYDVLEASLPAVVGVNWGAYEPRYPTFQGVRGARSKPVEALDAAGAGIDLARVGLAGSRSVVLGVRTRSAERRKVMVDNTAGDAHLKLADFLQEETFI
jgi:electron transfer flavoprotein beta subunit